LNGRDTAERARRPGRNIRRRGEELRAGSRIADAGARVTPGLLASLVSAGLGELRVRARPRIRVLVSGDELRAAGASLEPGQIHDSNGPLVTSVLERWACPPLSVERLPDREELVRAALETALADADLVISTGGASVGDRDYLPAAARALGLREVFWKVSQKPGKPLWFGVGGDPAANRRSAMLALPGNPGAVLIGLVLHVRRVLDLLEGAEPAAPQWRAGRLSGVVECDSQRERLLRMRLSFAADGTAELHRWATRTRTCSAIWRVPMCWCGWASAKAGSRPGRFCRGYRCRPDFPSGGAML